MTINQEYKFKTGYAFYLGDEDPLENEDSHFEDPETTLATSEDVEGAQAIGYMSIDDSECVIFRTTNNHFWAQTTVSAQV